MRNCEKKRFLPVLSLPAEKSNLEVNFTLRTVSDHSLVFAIRAICDAIQKVGKRLEQLKNSIRLLFVRGPDLDLLIVSLYPDSWWAVFVEDGHSKRRDRIALDLKPQVWSERGWIVKNKRKRKKICQQEPSCGAEDEQLQRRISMGPNLLAMISCSSQT